MKILSEKDVIANKAEDKIKMKRELDKIIKDVGKDSKKVHAEILKRVVNSRLIRFSNNQVQMIWDEYKKVFSS